jgi:hypothetical protein
LPKNLKYAKLLLIFVIVFLMFLDEKILHKLENTNLFTTKLKQELIWYFKYLTKTQKNNLLQALNTEQTIIKSFLSSLKDKNSLDFLQIKTEIISLKNKDRKLKELNERLEEENNIDNLLSSL